jgi:hypothetical protein
MNERENLITGAITSERRKIELVKCRSLGLGGLNSGARVGSISA